MLAQDPDRVWTELIKIIIQLFTAAQMFVGPSRGSGTSLG